MAVIAPVAGLICASTPSSSFAYSHRHLPFSRVSLRSSFLGVALKPIGIRLTHSDRFMCHGYSGGGQMHLFSRFARILKSYASSFISMFEDPEKILEQTVLEMDQELINMRKVTAQALASQKQIEMKYKSAQKTSEEWYEKAKLAMKKGDEDLVLEALNMRKTYADNASTWKAQLDQQNPIIKSIVYKTSLLQCKIEEAKSKKDTLKARCQSAKTATKLNELLGNVNPSDALATFGRVEEKVWAMEAQAQALNQLANDDLERKFAMLESFTIDDDLASLKNEILSESSTDWELPSWRPNGAAGRRIGIKDIYIEPHIGINNDINVTS